MLAVTVTSAPSTTNGVASRCCRTRSASIMACSGVVSGSSRTNSSPPIRARMSKGRISSRQMSGDVADHGVAHVVAKSIIDRLEHIDVEDQQRQRPVLALVPPPFILGEREEVPPVAETGQIVGRGQPLELLGVAHEVGPQNQQFAVGGLDPLARRPLMPEPLGGAGLRPADENRQGECERREERDPQRAVERKGDELLGLGEQHQAGADADHGAQIADAGPADIGREENRCQDEGARGRDLDSGSESATTACRPLRWSASGQSPGANTPLSIGRTLRMVGS